MCIFLWLPAKMYCFPSGQPQLEFLFPLQYPCSFEYFWNSSASIFRHVCAADSWSFSSVLLELFSGSLVLGLCTCWSSSPDKFPSWASRLSYCHAVNNLLLSPTLLFSWLYSGTNMIGVSNQSTYNLPPATHATKTLWNPFKAYSS